MRAVVPAGYMVASAETDGARYVTIKLCSGHGGGEQVLDLDTGAYVDPASVPQEPGTDKKAGDQACVFAAAHHAATHVSTVEPTAFRVFVEAAQPVVPRISPGRGIAAPPPPSTGPPALI